MEKLIPIGAVVEQLQQIYPDLSQSSLRFLEREGLVEPLRSAGGHRLYSQADIQRVRQIKEWQAHRLSLADIRVRLSHRDLSHSTDQLAAAVLDLYLKGRVREAQAMILAADATGEMSLASVFRDVISPILVEVGTRWECQELPVSLEKEISEANRDVIGELSFRHRSPELHGPPVVAAAVHGELHDLGLRMISGILGSAGFRVYYLGANVAPEHVAEAIDRHEASAVLLSVGGMVNLPSVARTREAIDRLPLAGDKVTLIVGGAAVKSHEDVVLAAGAIPLTVGDYEVLPMVIGGLIGDRQRERSGLAPAVLRLPTQNALGLADVERRDESG